MKKIAPYIFAAFTLLTTPAYASCESDNQQAAPQPTSPQDSSDQNQSNNTTMIITVGNKTFRATLADNPTAEALLRQLPMTVNMTEHAGNEKYYDLGSSLPTAASNPGTINAGDIMLYGSRTLVLFYKSFRTSYSYTRIGRLDDAAGLDAALGRGAVTVKFELQKAE